MAIETVLRNIYSYLEVLEAAHCKTVCHWSTNSLQNARKWAQYCEQIFWQAEGKPYVQKLDEQIKKLNCKPWNLGGCYIHLGLLRDARNHLNYALLQNAHLDAKLYQLVIKDCIETGQDIFIKACGQMTQPKATINIASTMKKSLNHGQLGTTMLLTRETATNYDEEATLEASALLLYKYLNHITRMVPVGPRTDAAIKEKINQLCDESRGSEVILRCIRLGTERGAAKKKLNSNILSALTSHFIDVIDANPSKRFLRLAPLSLVIEVANHSVPIFSAYMRHLVNEADYVSAPKAFSHAMPRKRVSSSQSSSYQEWFSSLEALYSAGGSVSRALMSTVEQLRRNEDSPVWQQAYHDLLKMTL